jgi:methylase of polypeptide subunit release factors
VTPRERMWRTTLYRANSLARRVVYRSRFVTRLLYGGWMEPHRSVSFWELCTLAMQRALRRDLRDGMRVLEIGTGPYGVLALWALSTWSLDLVATDVDEESVAHAVRTAQANGLKLDARCCDLLEGIEGDFDLIWFVPPVTPAETVDAEIKRCLTVGTEEARLARLRSCGGARGWELTDRFLAGVPARLRRRGRVYLSVNRHHQPDGTVAALLPRHGLALLDERRWRLPPYSVYVARKAAEGDGVVGA